MPSRLFVMSDYRTKTVSAFSVGDTGALSLLGRVVVARGVDGAGVVAVQP